MKTIDQYLQEFDDEWTENGRIWRPHLTEPVNVYSTDGSTEMSFRTEQYPTVKEMKDHLESALSQQKDEFIEIVRSNAIDFCEDEDTWRGKSAEWLDGWNECREKLANAIFADLKLGYPNPEKKEQKGEA